MHHLSTRLFCLSNVCKKLNEALESDHPGSTITMQADDYAWRLFRAMHGTHTPLPPGFVEARNLDPQRQLLLSSRLQAHVDQSISKTINLQASFDQFKDLFRTAHRLGLKGCTVFRAHANQDAVLARADQGAQNP